MTLDWREHPEASAEYLDAVIKYADVEDGSLGDEFADAADAASALISQWPDSPPPYLGRRRDPMIRSWNLGKFPYRLIYAVRAGEIFVLAYAHEAREPGYWSDRLDR
ncbi:MAG: hypothetical protein L0H74_08940 [Brachybacterium sp.]|nr:hypothetical protein [Brachybacterium sp.]